jgi:hypothetical protein
MNIDFEHIKWGSFSAQFKVYKAQHPYSSIRDLKSFAEMILRNPNKFQERTKKRAHFYLNVLNRK